MDFETLLFEKRDHVAKITLNRPKAANALNLQLASDLMDAATRCDGDADVRAVLLTGTGRFFCAGGDLRAFSTTEDIGGLIRHITTRLHAAVARFHRMNAPVIIAVNGTAAGGGFSLAISGDIVMAAQSARFTMGYAGIGFSPDGSSTYFLPRLVGLRRAQELALTDRMLSAEEAAAWGLVTRVLPDDALAEAAHALAARLASGPTRAYGSTKRLLAASWGNGLETQCELETREISARAEEHDGQEGVTAFLEKRKPAFTGK